MNSDRARTTTGVSASAVRSADAGRVAVFAGFALLAPALVAWPTTPDRSGVGPAPRATPAGLREIVRDAYIYGSPMVDSYRIQYSYFVDRADPEFKGDWNEVHSVARVFTPQDKAIQTPNSDTPYSFLGADLRAEPLVISVPAVPKDRHYSVRRHVHPQLRLRRQPRHGQRGGGLPAGGAGLAGTGVRGHQVRHPLETSFAFVLHRTQLFGASDLEAVKRIQAQYEV